MRIVDSAIAPEALAELLLKAAAAVRANTGLEPVIYVGPRALVAREKIGEFDGVAIWAASAVVEEMR